MIKYHTFWQRFWAGFVDSVIFMPVSYIDAELSDPTRSPFQLIAWGIISYSMYWLYSVLMHARYGQTIGKMVLKLRVLDLSEERIPSLRQAFMRDIGYIVPNTLLLTWVIYLVATGQYESQADLYGRAMFLLYASVGWFLLEVISMLTNSKRRAIHDFIARTVVVRTAQPLPRASNP